MEATAIDIARSLWIIYQQMPVAAQDEFRRLIDEEDDKFLDEIAVESKKSDYTPTITKGNKRIDPRALEGIWKDNPHTLEEIRRDVWGDRP